MAIIKKTAGTNPKTGLALELHFESLNVYSTGDNISISSKEIELDLEGNPYKVDYAANVVLQDSGDLSSHVPMPHMIPSENVTLTATEVAANKKILDKLKADIIALISTAYSSLKLK